MAKILRNWCRCKKCGDIIESKHVHDFVRCECGAIFTDGGLEYIRRGFEGNENCIEDLSQFDVIISQWMKFHGLNFSDLGFTNEIKDLSELTNKQIVELLDEIEEDRSRLRHKGGDPNF